MSVKTQISAGKMNPRHLENGIKKHLGKMLLAQGLIDKGQSVTLSMGPGQVRMHGSERADANFGVINFSDTEYQVGINRNEEGEFSFVYDSWVGVPNGKLTQRINGNGPAGTNLLQCEMIEKTCQFGFAHDKGVVVDYQREGGAKLFVRN